MTVADIIAELSKLPGHLPVAGECLAVEVLEGGIAGDETTETREVGAVQFQGRYVALVCDGPWLG